MALIASPCLVFLKKKRNASVPSSASPKLQNLALEITILPIFIDPFRISGAHSALRSPPSQMRITRPRSSISSPSPSMKLANTGLPIILLKSSRSTSSPNTITHKTVNGMAHHRDICGSFGVPMKLHAMKAPSTANCPYAILKTFVVR